MIGEAPSGLEPQLPEQHLARNTDKNQQIWHAKLVLATTGLHLAQFRQQHRLLAKTVDYANLFTYNEAQQEAALSYPWDALPQVSSAPPW